ncbi:MAG: bifunctional riboflavin kinase/FAD synthetase [Ferruginibacter sp.]
MLLFYMTVHTNIQQLPVFNNALITIGTFDGVHIGHQQIIQLMKSEAAKAAGETVIITFHPHPRKIIGAHPGPVYLLNTMEEKVSLLEKYGIDHLVVVPFTEAFANQPAEAYIADFLVNTFHPHTIIIGHDHRFGKGRSGDFQLLEDNAAEHGYEVKEIPGYMLKDMTISSTKIREALLEGDIETAGHFLGYEYFFSGKVVEGNKLGRTLGYPTANLLIEDENKLVPGNGVYAVLINNEDLKIYNAEGMMNIGFRPTVDGTRRVIEVNIFDFDKDIYGENLTITLKKHLRSEVKFNGLDELKTQLAKDKQAARAAL